MKPPRAFEDARRNAPIHVQIYLTGLEPRPETNGHVRVTGRVARIFRDDTRRMWTGKQISFFVPVVGSGRSEPILGGPLYHFWERVAKARWFEVFLYPTADGVELVESQLAPIRGPTVRPICDPKTTEGFVCEGNFPRTE